MEWVGSPLTQTLEVIDSTATYLLKRKDDRHAPVEIENIHRYEDLVHLEHVHSGKRASSRWGWGGCMGGFRG